MARQESDREDLLREATALVERAELDVAGYDEHVVIGFRRDGSGSIYLGPEPVYQFNSQLHFRRGYVSGRLIKAERGKLVSLDRQRRAGGVTLVRHDLDEVETAACLATLKEHLAKLRAALDADHVTTIGQVPPDTDVLERIAAWLARLSESIVVAEAPNVG